MSPVPPHSLSSGAFTAFLHLVSSPWKPSLWNSTQELSHSTSQPAESTWKQFSFNQVHYKGPSDANLSNTTILLWFFFFSSGSLCIILISSWALWNTVYRHNENSLAVYCSFRMDTEMGAFKSRCQFSNICCSWTNILKYLRLIQGERCLRRKPWL